MKYTIEDNNGMIEETLEYNKSTYTRTTRKRTGKAISGADFSDQMNGMENEAVLDLVYNLLDERLDMLDWLSLAKMEVYKV